MKIKIIPFKPKKIPYYLALSLLTLGASLILGFLSFGGMYALLPMLSLAFAAFGLSVAYEGEIYLQNIRGALNKLLKNDYLKNYLAKEYLLEHFPEDTAAIDCPQFFKDYEIQLKLLGTFGHKELNGASKKRKRQVEKTLGDMEKWFATQLFATAPKEGEIESAYTKELKLWLVRHEQPLLVTRLASRRQTFNIVKAFSATAALFMSLGSSYLILEAFLVIPALAALPLTVLPLLIVPMAVIAGIAYGMLTYNAITDLINNKTLLKWSNKLKKDFAIDGFSARNIFMGFTAALLVFLALGLTICTAGTWWTIATKAQPLFHWMTKMPSFVMGVINPIVTGISSLSFNIQNTAESLDMIDDATKNKKNVFTRIAAYFSKAYDHVRKTENWLQIFNPFRIILLLTITPLRIIFFLGHLLSIAVTADRMPGFPEIVSALIALISEGFEDMHYFVPGHHHHHEEADAAKPHKKAHAHSEPHHHKKHHAHSTKSLLAERLGAGAGHNHNADIPTLFLKTAAIPLYALATLWDFLASRLNHNSAKNQPATLTIEKAWNKQRGIAKEHDVTLADTAARPSSQWQTEQVISRIERYQTKHFDHVISGRPLADAKVAALDELKTTIRRENGGSLADTLRKARDNTVYNQHRLFVQTDDKTATQQFIEGLPERVNALR